MGWLRERRRARLKGSGLSDAWRRIVYRNVPYLRLFPPDYRAELEGVTRILIAEKRFEGAGGLRITDAIRLTIASQASLLLINRRTGYYPGLYSIIVYPGPYLARRTTRDRFGLTTDGVQGRRGESWKEGAIVLSWADVRRDAAEMGSGRNVVLHEFAHQLDAEAGRVDGVPILPDRSMYAAWEQAFQEGYERLQQEISSGVDPSLRPYGALNPGEFFAVATETFFERPRDLLREMPELYGQLRAYYKQDPAGFALRIPKR